MYKDTHIHCELPWRTAKHGYFIASGLILIMIANCTSLLRLFTSFHDCDL